MHLGNSVICPVTGIPMLIAMGSAVYYALKSAKKDFNKDKILPTIVLTVFVFCLQMINFSIPYTGASGHIIGGVLLAVLLGPSVAFISMTAILLVQALFFADGGILALGCNIFNMGFISCFVAYPLVYKAISKNKNPMQAIILSSILALELGSVAVVLESVLSGTVIKPFGFLCLMVGIHFAIAFVEGLFTAAIVWLAQKFSFSKVFLSGLSLLSIILAGIISNYASSKPDGLEWSLLNISNSFIAQTQGQIYTIAETIQAKTSILLSGFSNEAANMLGLIILAVMMLGFTVLVYKRENSVSEV